MKKIKNEIWSAAQFTCTVLLSTFHLMMNCRQMISFPCVNLEWLWLEVELFSLAKESQFCLKLSSWWKSIIEQPLYFHKGSIYMAEMHQIYMRCSSKVPYQKSSWNHVPFWSALTFSNYIVRHIFSRESRTVIRIFCRALLVRRKKQIKPICNFDKIVPWNSNFWQMLALITIQIYKFAFNSQLKIGIPGNE